MEGFKTMGQAKHVLVFTVCFFTMAAFAGCAGAAANLHPGNGPVESLRQGYEVVYHPKLRPGDSLDSVQKALDIIGAPKSWIVFVSDDTPHYRYWYPILHINIHNDSIELLKYNSVYQADKFLSNTAYQFPGSKLPFGSLYSSLSNDNLLKCTIAVERSKEEGDYPYVIFLKDMITFRFYKDDLAGAETIADALYFLQQEQKDNRDKLDKELARFQAIAAQYRALKVKPPVSEEQRKLIVQANYFSEQKEYGKALDLYKQAIAVDPVAYPAAYFNMALLSAQEHHPATAIFRMKQYLLLAPDAKDARSAQDNIYEWEAAMGK